MPLSGFHEAAVKLAVSLPEVSNISGVALQTADSSLLAFET